MPDELDDLLQPAPARFRYPDRVVERTIMLLDGSAPGETNLPVDGVGYEHFRLTGWDCAFPVYEPRD